MKTSQSVLVVGGTSGMGRATAELLAARGDDVIVGGRAVSPGVVDTEGWSHLGEDRQAALDTAGAALPVGRVGRSADVASTVVHLIDNVFTTGTIHHVDGGARLV